MSFDRRAQGARHVVVVGGGIAGISASLELARGGVRVTLLEAARRLGGRATSFVDQSTGATLDNCQHVALGCCSAYLDLCRALGVLDLLEWHRAQWWVERGGRTSVVRSGVLPAPLHFGPSFLGARFLPAPAKLAIAHALSRFSLLDGGHWAGRAFGDVLRELDQPAEAIARFWEPVIVSACNLHPERVEAGLGVKVFREGFMASKRGAMIALPRVPLVRLYDRAEALLRGAGSSLRLGARVEAITARSAILAGGEEIEADAVVCALPPERAARVIEAGGSVGASGPGTLADPRVGVLASVEHSPILGVHLTLDRAIVPTPHAVLVEGGTQWVFVKEPAGEGAQGLHCVVSAADGWMGLSDEQIVTRVLDDLRAYFPSSFGPVGGRSVEPRVLHARSVREKRATFAATPSFERVRPGNLADGDDALHPNFPLLAGDYTRTGWPATMESATRSGVQAARLLLGFSG